MAGTSNSIVARNVLRGRLAADNLMEGHIDTAFNPTYALVDEAGNKIVLYINSTNYQFEARLLNKNDEVINVSNIIDLPLETMVVNGEYDAETKEVILTLDNGNEIKFSVADLISGLQSEITSANMLSSDLVDDNNKVHKFVSTTEKTNWNNKLEQSDLTDYVKNTDYATDSVGGVIKVDGANYGSYMMSSGILCASMTTYANYGNKSNNYIISKGTLENVITGKDLTTKSYVDSLVGNIQTLLDNLNNGGGVQ